MCVGLIVPRFKHSAVDRNQLKRRLRELVRIQLLPTAIPIDLVIRIKPVAYVATFAMLEREVLRARDQLAEWHARQGAQDPPSGDTL
jgi:ribonuclease P protein component